MQTMYMGRPVGPSAGMIFCQNELERMKEGELRQDCYQSGEGYRCVVQYKGKCNSFGSFETIALCNAHYDKQLNRLSNGIALPKKTRKPVPKGYRTCINKESPPRHYPYIILNKKRVELGATGCKKEARKMYLARFELEFGPVTQ